MKTASLDLCKELYKLSEWGFDEFEGRDKTLEWVNDRDEDNTLLGSMPLYDLGYLLRKLPDNTILHKTTDTYYEATLNQYEYHWIADTPEDAVAKLAIELYKKGTLT